MSTIISLHNYYALPIAIPNALRVMHNAKTGSFSQTRICLATVFCYH